MTEELGTSQYSLPWSQPTQIQQRTPPPSFKQHRVTCLLILAGFYFLIFAAIELVTNFSESVLEAEFVCDARICQAKVQDISFPKQGRIYLYLISPKISQKLAQGLHVKSLQIITNCSTFSTNEQMAKTISVSGVDLDLNAQAYPCGETALHYPQGILTMKNKLTLAQVVVNQSDLSVTNYGFKNQDINLQWADVETSRYWVWTENQVGLMVRKYWGFVDDKLSGDYLIQLKANNQLIFKFTTGLKIQLTDNKSLDGYNVPLCAFQFAQAVVCFFLGGFSFYFRSRNKTHSVAEEQIQSEKENIFAPTALNSQNSVFIQSLRMQS